MAPAIGTPLRSHSYAYERGPFRNPPLTQVSVWPTSGAPDSVGLPTGTGESTRSSVPTMLTSRSRVDLLPALSIASAVSVTLLPTFDFGGV